MKSTLLRNCEACGKPIENPRGKQKWHYECRTKLPGYKAGYQAGYEAGHRSMDKLLNQSPINRLTKGQRLQIAREELEEAKAERERKLADLQAKKALLGRERDMAECHERMVKAGFELPPFQVDPAVEALRVEENARDAARPVRA